MNALGSGQVAQRDTCVKPPAPIAITSLLPKVIIFGRREHRRMPPRVVAALPSPSQPDGGRRADEPGIRCVIAHAATGERRHQPRLGRHGDRRHHGQGRFATPSAPPVTSRAQRPRRRTDAADTDHCVQSATRRSCLLPVIARAPRSARSCGAATAGCQQARGRPANDVRGRKAANPAETWPPTRHDLTILIDGR